MQAFAELTEDGDRCQIHFRYSPEHVLVMNRLKPLGARFRYDDERNPEWTVPLDLVVMRRRLSKSQRTRAVTRHATRTNHP